MWEACSGSGCRFSQNPSRAPTKFATPSLARPSLNELLWTCARPPSKTAPAKARYSSIDPYTVMLVVNCFKFKTIQNNVLNLKPYSKFIAEHCALTHLGPRNHQETTTKAQENQYMDKGPPPPPPRPPPKAPGPKPYHTCTARIPKEQHSDLFRLLECHYHSSGRVSWCS